MQAAEGCHDNGLLHAHSTTMRDSAAAGSCQHAAARSEPCRQQAACRAHCSESARGLCYSTRARLVPDSPPPRLVTSCCSLPSSRPASSTVDPGCASSRLLSADPMPPEAPNTTYTAGARVHGNSRSMSSRSRSSGSSSCLAGGGSLAVARLPPRRVSPSLLWVGVPFLQSCLAPKTTVCVCGRLIELLLRLLRFVGVAVPHGRSLPARTGNCCCCTPPGPCEAEEAVQ